MKNVSQRAFYHWLRDNYGHLFPKLPHRTRLNRRLRSQQHWTGYFLAQPTVQGVADSYGIELRHPVREGRRPGQIGKKGKSNHRWIVGGTLCVALNNLGLVADWDCATGNVHDQTFQPLLACYEGQMIISSIHPLKPNPHQWLFPATSTCGGGNLVAEGVVAKPGILPSARG